MERKDLHVHTTYSDGANTPEEIVLAAIASGLDVIGFSDHSYTFFDESYCIRKGMSVSYRAEIASLKEQYRDQITVLCGIEQDYYSAESTDGYDYVIGSVHYIMADGTYIPVDEDADTLLKAVSEHFGGDIYSLIEEYYRTVSDVADKTHADIIGHFDLITKFNENAKLFDERHPRYRAAWTAAADKLLASRIPFEINTGAMSRGYRSTPYPSTEIREYILAQGGEFILSSDSHSTETLCYGFM